MASILTYSEEYLKSYNGYWTAKEISQQPTVWRKTAKYINELRKDLEGWLNPILATQNLRIILTGAGTSAYVGDSIAPHLTQKTGRVFEAISTTDIVACPEQMLLKNAPTLLVSYGRSGNSPESVAAVELADQVIDDCYHLIITCNADGELAQCAQNNKNCFSLLMPEETLDKSFAMTSSFTSMLVSTLLVFARDMSQLETAAEWTENLLMSKLDQIKEMSTFAVERLVFLGAGGLQGISREAALKVLELTAGKVLSYSESPLGFRHGPKSLMNPYTQVIFMASADPYTRRYDVDLLLELDRDNKGFPCIVLNQKLFSHDASLEDVWAGLPYIVYCQALAFFKSIQAEIAPDNPCPTGEVNRVVQGVTLYPLNSE